MRVRMADEPLIADVVQRQDVIFNCAAQTSHPLSLQLPIHDAEINCLGNLKVLEAVRLLNPEAVIVYTSSTVIGTTLGTWSMRATGSRSTSIPPTRAWPKKVRRSRSSTHLTAGPGVTEQFDSSIGRGSHARRAPCTRSGAARKLLCVIRIWSYASSARPQNTCRSLRGALVPVLRYDREQMARKAAMDVVISAVSVVGRFSSLDRPLDFVVGVRGWERHCVCSDLISHRTIRLRL